MPTFWACAPHAYLSFVFVPYGGLIDICKMPPKADATSVLTRKAMAIHGNKCQVQKCSIEAVKHLNVTWSARFQMSPFDWLVLVAVTVTYLTVALGQVTMVTKIFEQRSVSHITACEFCTTRQLNLLCNVLTTEREGWRRTWQRQDISNGVMPGSAWWKTLLAGARRAYAKSTKLTISSSNYR